MARKPTKDLDRLVNRNDLYNTGQDAVEITTAVPAQTTQIYGLTVDDLIKDLTDADGLVLVKVLVSHDNLYAGNEVRLPPSERLVSMLIAGWLEA